MAAKGKGFLLAFLLIVLVAIGGGGWLIFSGSASSSDAAGFPPGSLTKAERRDLESKLLLSGEVKPASLVEVKSEVGGKVKEILVTVNSKVKKGDVLAIVDDRDLLTEKQSAQTAVDGAKLSVDKDRGNYDRAKALFDEKLISKEVYANLEADLRISENAQQKADSALQSVEDRLSKTRIIAPSDGIVLDIAVNEGQVVSAAASVNSGTTLMTFADLGRLLIETNVNQMDVNKLTAGQRVSVNMQGDDANVVPAHIEFVAPLATVVDNIKGFKVQALIEGTNTRLKPGMSVSMTVPVANAKGAVSVPITAVFTQNNERVVFVRKGGNTERRKVRVGLTNMSFAEITSGLSEGEEILLVEPRTTSANPS
jgi:RND family efflux transporter MFP subunit